MIIEEFMTVAGEYGWPRVLGWRPFNDITPRPFEHEGRIEATLTEPITLIKGAGDTKTYNFSQRRPQLVTITLHKHGK